MTETDVRWAPIPRFPGYEASTLGSIRYVSPLGKKRFLQGAPTRTGHVLVYIRPEDGSKASRQYVHRLVLEAHVGPGDGLYACHYDDDPANNKLKNLRWGTAQDNSDDLRRNLARVKSSELRPIHVDASWPLERQTLTVTRNQVADKLTALDHQRRALIAELRELDQQIQVVAGPSVL